MTEKELIERLRAKVRRRDLESGMGWLDSTGKGGFKSNGEVWQPVNPDGNAAADLIEQLQSAFSTPTNKGMPSREDVARAIHDVMENLPLEDNEAYLVAADAILALFPGSYPAPVSQGIEEALKPFAVAAEVWPEHIADEHCVSPGRMPLTLGDLRRAREAFRAIRALRTPSGSRDGE